MRVLLIKTSSMGDILHTLPALTDAGKAIADIKFDWVIEESFAEIPHWHPNVDKVIPVALRRWRKGIFSSETRSAWKKLRHELRECDYDLILDAQGLMKSAFISLFAKGERAGLDWKSAREAPASIVYQHKCNVNFYQHAIIRMRSLFSQALGYTLTTAAPDFAINLQQFRQDDNGEKYLVFLHGTTWSTKEWPETYWMQLAKMAANSGYKIKISGGNEKELARAQRIANQCDAIEVLPRLSIAAMAALLVNAKGAVAVDTGFGHLAAALEIPIVSLYGPTNPEYTGAIGNSSVHLAVNFPCSPCLSRACSYKSHSTVAPACYETLAPAYVWGVVEKMISPL